MCDASIEGKATITATVSVRNYMASQHLWMAQHSAAKCAALEPTLKDRGVPTHPELRGYAVAAVTLSVAFIEAVINEAFEDAEAYGARVQALPVDTARLMAAFWSDGERHVGTLDKYQLALLFNRAEQFNKGGNPYQNANTLVQFRNALSHFKPIWHQDHAPRAMNRRLPGLFEKSGLLGKDDGSDWSIWALAAPGAHWAVDTASAFVGAWSDRMGLERHYEADLANFDREVAKEG